MTDTRPSEAREAATVLIVEDDEGLRSILGRYLRHTGLVVEDAGSAEEAVAILRRGTRPALVVLDINLPGDTGWDVLRSDAFTGAGSPPVLVASAVPVSPKRLTEFHVAGYLPKPFPIETLTDTIERLLHREETPQGT